MSTNKETISKIDRRMAAVC